MKNYDDVFINTLSGARHTRRAEAFAKSFLTFTPTRKRIETKRKKKAHPTATGFAVTLNFTECQLSGSSFHSC